jgi:hypothetical protein
MNLWKKVAVVGAVVAILTAPVAFLLRNSIYSANTLAQWHLDQVVESSHSLIDAYNTLTPDAIELPAINHSLAVLQNQTTLHKELILLYDNIQRPATTWWTLRADNEKADSSALFAKLEIYQARALIASTMAEIKDQFNRLESTLARSYFSKDHLISLLRLSIGVRFFQGWGYDDPRVQPALRIWAEQRMSAIEVSKDVDHYPQTDSTCMMVSTPAWLPDGKCMFMVHNAQRRQSYLLARRCGKDNGIRFEQTPKTCTLPIEDSAGEDGGDTITGWEDLLLELYGEASEDLRHKTADQPLDALINDGLEEEPGRGITKFTPNGWFAGNRWLEL